MNDLIKRFKDAPNAKDGEARMFTLDEVRSIVGVFVGMENRLTAMKAAGDGLEDYTGHDQRCEIMTHGVWTDPIPCTCGLTAAIKQWKEASDGL